MTTERPVSRNQKVIDEFRANKGKVGPSTHPLGDRLLLLTTTGRKSGASHTTPLAYHRDGNRLIIVASKGGAPENPAWYHNLKSKPAVIVEVGDEKYDAQAAILPEDERARIYAKHAE